MKNIRIAGVPEHFNLPWHMCIENGEFNEAGIDLQWTDVPEGTGKMCQMLRDNETDTQLDKRYRISPTLPNCADWLPRQSYPARSF